MTCCSPTSADLQRARDRRRASAQHVAGAPSARSLALSAGAEPLLLVDDHQRRGPRTRRPCRRPRRCRPRCDAPVLEPRLHPLPLRRGHQPRQPATSIPARRSARGTCRDAGGQGPWWAPRCHLPARQRRRRRGAHRHLGLAEADVAEEQPVHRPARREVGEHGVDRARLVHGFGEGKPAANCSYSAASGSSAGASRPSRSRPARPGRAPSRRSPPVDLVRRFCQLDRRACRATRLPRPRHSATTDRPRSLERADARPRRSAARSLRRRHRRADCNPVTTPMP